MDELASFTRAVLAIAVAAKILGKDRHLLS